MDNNNNTSVNFSTLLGLLFIGLKLCHVIDWSWWYVTMPLWIGLPIGLIILVVILLIHSKY